MNKRFIFIFVIPAIIMLNTSSITLKDADKESYAVRTIVIDAGHGGKDPGTMGKIAREKNISLNIALKLGEYVNKYIPGTKVVYTRDDDTFIPLQGRAEIANKNNADLFISIHVNSISGKPTVAGTETYVMGLHKEEANLKVAMRENLVIQKEENFEQVYNGFDPDSDESYIIFNLYQSAFLESSVNLAEKIQSQFGKRVGRKNRGVKQAGFWVLWATKMPSVLIETGYITNPEEEKYLNSKEGQALMASGIFRALRDYINEVDQLNVDNK